jgi:hypothetical protein
VQLGRNNNGRKAEGGQVMRGSAKAAFFSAVGVMLALVLLGAIPALSEQRMVLIEEFTGTG